MSALRRWKFLSSYHLLAFLALSLWLVGCGDPADDVAIVLTIRSEVLQQDREILVRLPAGYDSSLAYPTVYVLDGSSLDIPIADAFAGLSAEGRAPEVVVIGIPNMTAENRVDHLTPPVLRTDVEDPGSPLGQGDQFLTFIRTELVPYVESRFRSSGMRAFVGHSRGGLLVVYSLVEHPELFQARFCFSAPLWRQDHRVSEHVRSGLDSVKTSASFLYVSVGDGENENILRGYEHFLAILEQHAPRHLQWRARITPNAGHQENAQRSARDAVEAWHDHLRAGEARADSARP